MYAFIAQARRWKAEAKLNHFQISSKYLINFYTIVLYAGCGISYAVLGAVLPKNVQNSSICVPFGQLNSILLRLLRYDTRCYLNVCSKAAMSQVGLVDLAGQFCAKFCARRIAESWYL